LQKSLSGLQALESQEETDHNGNLDTTARHPFCSVVVLFGHNPLMDLLDQEKVRVCKECAIDNNIPLHKNKAHNDSNAVCGSCNANHPLVEGDGTKDANGTGSET
jgi:hypothetical protein